MQQHRSSYDDICLFRFINIELSPAHYQGLLYVMLTAIHTTHTEDEVPALIPYIAKPRPTQCDVGTHITVCLVHIQSPCVADVQECTYTYTVAHTCANT